MSKLTNGIAAVLLVVITGCAGSNEPRVQKDIPAPAAPPVPPPVKNESLDVALRESAKREIRLAAVSNDPRLRANAIEAAQNVFGADSHDMVVAGLGDREPIVRFAALMAAGTLRFNDLHNAALRLSRDSDQKVRIGALFALHRMGDATLTHELEKTARDPKIQVRLDTAFVLGLMEEPSARKILRQMLREATGPDEGIPDLRIQIADSLWRLHDEEALELLVAGSISHFVDEQMLCLIALAAPHDSRVVPNIRGKLTDPYIEVSLVAARAMGELGKDDGYAVAMKSIKAADPRQRYLAATALGAIGRSDAQDELASLLKDSEATVRIASARAILQLKSAA